MKKKLSPKTYKLVVNRETIQSLDSLWWLHKIEGGYFWPTTLTTNGSASC